MFQNFLRKKSKSNKNEFEAVEQSIRNTNRACNPIRSFSVEEIPTSDFQQERHKDWNYTIYEGTHRDRKIYAKKFALGFDQKDDVIKKIAIEVEIASRMSNHPNVLKLLGYCLETELPVLIYEFPENGNLYKSLFDELQAEKLSWDQKLKIAIETANSIAYLHHGLTNTFVHRDIRPGNIFLDRNLSPRLFGFQIAVRIPEGDTGIEAVRIAGTPGYLDPEVLFTSQYTKKSDVYGFGVLLFEVLTEEKIYESLNFHHSISYKSSRSDNQLLDDFVRETVERCKDYLEDERIRVQVIEYVKLMKRCLKKRGEDRPDIIEAEMALRSIKNI